MKKKQFSFHNPELSVPGDKSLSHRFVIFSSMTEGVSECTGFLEAEDPLATMKSFSQLGVTFQKTGAGSYRVESPGMSKLQSPQGELDFGNGGTGIRLSCGFLAGIPGMSAILTGDASLCKRPMARILDPLKSLGGDVVSMEGNGKAPLRVSGKKLKNGVYNSPIASAQVKSCLMFAVMASQAELDYQEPEVSRNHTENMFRFLGGEIEYLSETRFRIRPPYRFAGKKFAIPGDISSAAFFIVWGLLAEPGSKLTLRNIGLNPSRIGILEVLERMGGRISILNRRQECGEETGDLEVEGSILRKVDIPSSLIPSIIDEIPILTIAGLFSKGGFAIRNAKELRAKESDRIHSMVSNLKRIGIPVIEYEDGYEFPEWDFNGREQVEIETFMDHRIAMSFSILNQLVDGKFAIDDTSWVETSFPGFFDLVESIRPLNSNLLDRLQNLKSSQEPYVIAIDGPAGSGKSTVAREVGKYLGIQYLDSGAFYRALTLYLHQFYLQENPDIDFPEWVLRMESQPEDLDMENLTIELEMGRGKENKIFLNGRNITAEIRTPEITEKIKYVADKQIFRDFVNENIRNLAKSNSLVMDGRDIGTQVFPDTGFKFFLTASPEVRARRRLKELHEKGISAEFQEVFRDMVRRDESDQNRKIAPLVQSKDAILVDTDRLSIKVVIETILSELSAS